jgi:hypothetical protein
MPQDASSVSGTTGPGSTVLSETSYGQSATAGTSTDYSRANHTHGSPSLTTTAPVALSTTAAVGIGTTPARHDHVHPSANLALKPASGDAILYVSTAGSDANDGLSWGSAKLTINVAISALPATGGTIEIGAGTFNNTGLILPAAGNFILRGQGRNVTILNNTHATFSGIAVVGAGSGGTPYAQHFEISDLGLTASAVNSGQVGLSLRLCRDYTVRNVQITGYGIGVNDVATWRSVFINVHALSCEYGWKFPTSAFTTATPKTFLGCSATSASITGIYLEDLIDTFLWSGGDLAGCANGVTILGAQMRNLVFDGVNFEVGTGNDVIIGDATNAPAQVLFRTCRFLRNSGSPGTLSVDMIRGTKIGFDHCSWLNYTKAIATSPNAGTITTVAPFTSGVTTFATVSTNHTVTTAPDIMTGSGAALAQINGSANQTRFEQQLVAALGFASSGGATILGGASDTLAFYGGTPTAKLTVSGSRAGNPAVASVLSQLATLGLVTNSSSAGNPHDLNLPSAIALGSTAYREPFSRFLAISNMAVLSSGVMLLVGLPLYAGDVVTNLSFCSGTTALTQGTNNDGHWWFALYSPDGANLLAQTADQTTAAWGASTVKTLALTAAQTISTTGLYLVGLMANPGTGGSPAVPSMRGIIVNSVATTGSTGWPSGVKTLAATAGSGLTTTAPAGPLTLTTSLNALHCIAS